LTGGNNVQQTGPLEFSTRKGNENFPLKFTKDEKDNITQVLASTRISGSDEGINPLWQKRYPLARTAEAFEGSMSPRRR